MTRVLITGAAGQLGHDLVAAFDDPRYEVLGATREVMDLVNRDSVLAAVCGFEPDIVIHGAAWTAVDLAESEPEDAFSVNAFGTRNVAEGARRVGAHVVYVSTDYVYDGSKVGPYHEWDETGPTSVYGASKLAGERELDPGSTIVRTGWICGVHGNNFVKTMLRLATERDTWNVVADQYGQPMFSADLAAALKQLAVGRLPGVFHLKNAGETTWHGFACAILEAAGHDPARINPIPTTEYPTPATRPMNSALAMNAWHLAGFDALDDWHEPLARMIKEIS